MAKKKPCIDPTHTKRNGSGECKECYDAYQKWYHEYRKKNPQARAPYCTDPAHTKRTTSAGCNECQAEYMKKYRRRGYRGYVQLAYCEICFITPADTGKPLVTDHDHETGLVRGTLCHHCNLLLGHADDNLVILRNAMRYLKR